jgi:multicomponent Na+:H+ antiporter subunit F
MHETVFFVATVWMAVLLSVCIVILVVSRSAMVRVLALDSATIMLISLLVLFSDSRRVPYYLDAALVLALLSFMSALAAARYHSEGKIF